MLHDESISFDICITAITVNDDDFSFGAIVDVNLFSVGCCANVVEAIGDHRYMFVHGFRFGSGFGGCRKVEAAKVGDDEWRGATGLNMLSN